MELVSPNIIDGILKDLLQELEGLFKTGQQIIFTNTVDRDVRLDRHLVKNILVNLISNAIKFTSEEGIIKVISSVDGHDFSISIEDNGIGISEEDQQHLFERFFRARNAGNIQGTGLGLHIVAKYLELMRGRITMKSALGVYSIFTIYISQNTIAEQP